MALDGNCPIYKICPCCGVEFGNEDYTIESTKWDKHKWIIEGTNWFIPKEKPEQWNKEEQFKHIPEKFIQKVLGDIQFLMGM